MDDTTTTLNINDDDRMLILSGPERLKYFGDSSPLELTRRAAKPSWLQRLKGLFN